jgi:hypothetical protein
MKGQVKFTIVLWVGIILSFQNLYAFENQRTHPALTERAAVASTINECLKTQLEQGDKTCKKK